MKGKDSVLAVTKRPFKVVAAWLALFMVLSTAVVVGTSSMLSPPEAHAAPGTGTSTPWGYFTLTVSASPETVPAGGGDVTYTYKVKNNSPYYNMYSRGGLQDANCSPNLVSGMNYWYGYSYIPANGTATWTCTTFVDETTTSTATIRMAPNNWSAYTSTATASVTVNKGTSAAPDFTVMKTASKSQVIPGGEDVTYTYKVKNTTNVRQYLVETPLDDNCDPLVLSGGPLPTVRKLGTRQSYIPAGQTATWTCTKKIQQDTINTATVTLANGFKEVYPPGHEKAGQPVWLGSETITDQAEVTVKTPSGINCDDIWYSGDDRPSTPMEGTIGTVNPGTGVATPTANIGTMTGYQSLQGSAAIAVDRTDPKYVYFSPRKSFSSSSPGSYYAGWVYRFNQLEPGAGAVLINSNLGGGGGNQYDDDISSVRLAVDASGTLWTINAQEGRLYSMNPDPPHPRTWEDKGIIELPTSGNFLCGSKQQVWNPELGAYEWVGTRACTHSDLESGDIAFDGNGTLYYIVADRSGTPKQGYLLTITSAELNASTTVKPAKAGYVGKMGNYGFNGIAFTSEGKAYVTSDSHIHELDIVTGKASNAKPQSEAEISDLASCAIPKADLRVTKRSHPQAFVKPGDTVTWTIEVENIGTLAATGVEFVDNITDGTAVSSKLNGNYNGSVSTDPYGAEWYEVKRKIKSPESAHEGVIGPGQKAVIEIVVEVPEPAQGEDPINEVCNIGYASMSGVTASFESYDPSNPGSLDSKTCVSVSNAKINLEKTAPCLPDNKGTVAPATFTMKVTNPGNEPFGSVSVTDEQCKGDNAPARVSASEVGDEAALDDGDDNLDANETWYYQCTVETGSAITNTAKVTGTTLYSQQTKEDEDSSTVELPALSLKKTATTEQGDDTASPGEVVKYTLNIKNDGPPPKSTQEGITLADTLPQGLDIPADGVLVERTYWVTESGSRKPKTDTVTLKKTEHGRLEIFKESDNISLEPYDENATNPEEITVTLDVTVKEDISLVDIPDLTNTALAVPETTQKQCPVWATVNNPLTAKYQFTVKKQSSNCDVGQTECGLEGAEFALYGEATPATVPPSMASTPITNGIKADSVTEGLNSSTFTSAELRAGRYWLVETKSPAGFNLLAEPIEFVLSVDTDGVPVVTLADPSTHGNIVTITAGKKDSSTGAITPPQIVINDTTPAPLPLTGGPGTMPYVLWGSGLILGGGLLALRRKTSGRLTTSGVKK